MLHAYTQALQARVVLRHGVVLPEGVVHGVGLLLVPPGLRGEHLLHLRQLLLHQLPIRDIPCATGGCGARPIVERPMQMPEGEGGGDAWHAMRCPSGRDVRVYMSVTSLHLPHAEQGIAQ